MTLICATENKSTAIVVTLRVATVTLDLEVLDRLEDYVFNPQPGQTFESVIGKDLNESLVDVTEIRCQRCKKVMPHHEVKSHFLTEEAK